MKSDLIKKKNNSDYLVMFVRKKRSFTCILIYKNKEKKNIPNNDT